MNNVDKKRQLEKLNILQENPDLSLFDKMESVNGKLKAIKSVLSDINLKEVKTYEEEIENIVNNLSEIKSAFEGKDMVVNINLESVVNSVNKVESAISFCGEWYEHTNKSNS